jgi:hypothetical protein
LQAPETSEEAGPGGRAEAQAVSQVLENPLGWPSPHLQGPEQRFNMCCSISMSVVYNHDDRGDDDDVNEDDHKNEDVNDE